MTNAILLLVIHGLTPPTACSTYVHMYEELTQSRAKPNVLECVLPLRIARIHERQSAKTFKFHTNMHVCDPTRQSDLAGIKNFRYTLISPTVYIRPSSRPKQAGFFFKMYRRTDNMDS